VLLELVELFGGFKKNDDNPSRLLAIKSLLLSFLGVIIRKTHPITRLLMLSAMYYLKSVFLVLLQPKLFSMRFTKSMWQGDIITFFLCGNYYVQFIYQLVVASIIMVWRCFGL
jgi:hypothetical protein